MDIFYLTAIIMAIGSATFTCFEIFRFWKFAKDDVANIEQPKLWTTKRGIIGAIVNLPIGIINSVKLVVFAIQWIAALVMAIPKSPGFLLDIGATLFFTWMFGGAFSALTMTMGLGASNVFSIAVMVWEHKMKKDAVYAADWKAAHT